MHKAALGSKLGLSPGGSMAEFALPHFDYATLNEGVTQAFAAAMYFECGFVLAANG